MGYRGLAAFAVLLLTLACTGMPPAAPDGSLESAEVTASNTSPLGSFRYRPASRSGQAPFAFEVNMCRSVDPDLGDDLRFVVSWGDGDEDRGLCYLRHTYRRAGRYEGRACVSDRVRDSVESCEDFVVEVAPEVDPPPPPASFIVRTATINPGAANNVSGNLYTFLNAPIPVADLQSATRIEIRYESATLNTCPLVQLGLADLSNAIFNGGSLNFAGQTGTFATELTPGQFTTPLTFDRAAMTIDCTGTTLILSVPGTVTVTLYR